MAYLLTENHFMTVADEITIIANQLANQGKKPTVALIKTKLGKPTPLPTIISTLKNWTHDANHIELSHLSEENPLEKQGGNELSPEIAQAIKQALKPIETELAELKANLKQLTEQVNQR